MKRFSALVPFAALILVLAGSLASAQASAATTTVRKPLLAMIRSLPVAAPSHGSSYNRDREFGDWIYHNTGYGHCNTRALVLIQESRARTTRNSHCTVETGKWISMYNNAVITYAYGGKQIQIDHMVPVENAWVMGAWAWTQARRVAFYNDLGDARSLNAVDSHDNDVKSDNTPLNWMPKVNRCRYITDWTAVKTRWGLRVTSAEKAALLKYAAPCGNPVVSVTRVN